MQRRLIAAITAVVLAGIGAILLFNYVAAADQRAQAGQKLVTVYVVTQQIDAGKSASELSGYVETKDIPAVAVAQGYVQSLADIQGKVASTTLMPGEQLLLSRFVEPGSATNGEVTVPAGMQLVTVKLEAQRSLGGELAPGNKVGVYVTYDEKTKQILQDVLVYSAGGEGDGDGITLALAPNDVSKVISAAEGAKLWLVKESKQVGNGQQVNLKQLVG